MKNFLYLLLVGCFALTSCQSKAQKKPKSEQFEIQKSDAEWKKELT
ncbi:MAG TPA: peptide-methionine (R)-S-oxide reductase, partial [Flavobacteriaceae bacterium]|nr:peptide-methionine (R)-S-oxide reductase [Flavobacteriaceae bacterium]